MTFLGIQLDSQRQVASLPQDKLAALLVSLQQHIQFYREESSYEMFASFPDRQALLRNQSYPGRLNLPPSLTRLGALSSPPGRHARHKVVVDV